MDLTNLKILRRAFIDSLPVLMGYSTMGFAAGVLLGARGDVPFSPIWGFLSSLLFVSGTLSFAFVSLVAQSASLATVAAVTLAINFRYVFYGISMLSRWKTTSLPKKLFLIHMLTDETYALETASRVRDPGHYEKYCTYLSALNLSYWVGGVTAGCLVIYIAEKALSPERLRTVTQGIEFAMVALLLVILTDQIREFVRRGR